MSGRYARAPGDVVRADAPIADLLVPDWGGAQAEYLAVRRTGDAALASATRQRLILLGMPAGLVDQVARTGRIHNVVTISTPIGGAIKTLAVRQGMTVAEGQTLVEVDGLATVWLNAAVPEVIAGTVRVGAPATATLAAFPGESFSGRVTAVLPTTDITSRTLTVRIELPNHGGRLRPGMFANVSLGDGAREALLIPSEAVIRTGTRTLVMLAQPGGRYRPAEIRTGAQSGDHTEILAGLSPGEKVVASGQFLIDSEASLAGVSGRLADATGKFWPITILGYVVQMTAVPLLAFTGSWPMAAVLILLERIGKAIRNPPRDVMLSHAARQAGGYGWAFGVHEAMDQAGAMIGPLVMAAVLAHHGSYREAFAILALPASITLLLLLAARWSYGIFWFLGSAAIGFLYDRSLPAAITFCVVAELAAIPFFLWVARHAEASAT